MTVPGFSVVDRTDGRAVSDSDANRRAYAGSTGEHTVTGNAEQLFIRHGYATGRKNRLAGRM